MYCIEPTTKRQKTEQPKRLADKDIVNEIKKEKSISPILENKERSFRKKCLKNGNTSILKRLSRFPRTVIDHNVVESKFFSNSTNNSETNENIESDERKRNPFKKYEKDNTSNSQTTSDKVKMESNISIVIEESPEKSRNPFKKSIESNKSAEDTSNSVLIESQEKNEGSFRNMTDNDETICIDIDSSQKENSPYNSPVKRSPILEPSPRTKTIYGNIVKKLDKSWSEDTVIENTYPMEMLVTPVDSQVRAHRLIQNILYH